MVAWWWNAECSSPGRSLEGPFLLLDLLLLFIRCVWQPHELQHTRLPYSSLSLTVLLKLISIESVKASNHLILCHPLLFLPSIFPSIRAFANELAPHIRWLKCWSFSFSISSSNEYSGLLFFRIDWFDFLAVQASLKSLLQHHSSNASILWCSAFRMVQLSQLIYDHRKNHSLD